MRYLVSALVGAVGLMTTAQLSAQIGADGISGGQILNRGGASDPRSRSAPVPDYRQYEYGKEIWQVKLACAECPLGDVALDEAVARRFLEDQSLWTTLDRKEQDAVSAFLKQRFSFNSSY